MTISVTDEEAEDSYDDLVSDLENDDEQHTVKPKESKLKDKQNENKKDSKTETEEMEKAKQELPYTFTGECFSL